jgi:hypothetical protein
MIAVVAWFLIVGTMAAWLAYVYYEEQRIAKIYEENLVYYDVVNDELFLSDLPLCVEVRDGFAVYIGDL